MASGETGVNKVHCLGVAAGWPCHARRHSAYLYRLGGSLVLVDCGVGVSGAYLGMGFGPDDVDEILLSHQHSDHVGGFSMLIQGMWVGQRRKPLVVRAPALAIPALKAWLEATLLFDELMGFPIRWIALEAGKPFRIADLAVTPHPTTHLAALERAFGSRHPATSFETFGFVLECEGLRVGHSADLGAVSDLEPFLDRPLDLMVCELAHVEADELFTRLGRAEIRDLVFIHLENRWWDHREALQRLAEAHLPGKQVRIAQDGDRIPIVGWR